MIVHALHSISLVPPLLLPRGRTFWGGIRRLFPFHALTTNNSRCHSYLIHVHSKCFMFLMHCWTTCHQSLRSIRYMGRYGEIWGVIIAVPNNPRMGVSVVLSWYEVILFGPWVTNRLYWASWPNDLIAETLAACWGFFGNPPVLRVKWLDNKLHN